MKTNKNKKLIAIGLMLSMFVLYGVLPLPQDAKAINALKDAKDLITDSDLGATDVTHTITFVNETLIPANGYTEVTFESGIGLASSTPDSITCSNSGTASWQGDTARCTYASGQVAASSSMSIVISDTINPSVEDLTAYTVDIETYDNLDVLLDRITVMVYFINDIWMTANVEPILAFTINGVDADQDVNGVNCDVTTTATTTPFETLVVNTPKTICQRLNVTTNADDGYIVTVEQDQELTSDSGSNINSFDNSPNNTGSTTAHVWAAPTNTLDAYHTYGHMGVTSDDQDLNVVNPNLNYYNGGAAAQYAGLNSTDPLLVMAHDGPSDGAAQNIGEAFVAYTAEIASLQEAGDYENTLTYIVTPTY